MKEKLTTEEIEHFIRDGYIRLEDAFPADVAREALDILWKDTGCDEHDPTTWNQPVIRLGEYGQEPFRRAANTPLLQSAFNQLAGEGNWVPKNSLGTFPVRFPSVTDPQDTGWHVDASFPGDDPADYLQWRINVKSKGRALLVLFLFSDVEEFDAPTRIIPGSHRQVARLLESKGDAGLSFFELAGALDISGQSEEARATGKAGTVYLCHPFMAHAAQPHTGKNPRLMAQAALAPRREFDIYRKDSAYVPIELAIREGLGLEHGAETGTPR